MNENMTQMKGNTSNVASLGHRSCRELSALANSAGCSDSQIVAMMLRDHARGVLLSRLMPALLRAFSRG